MKVYRVELMILDFDGLGEDGISETIECTRYPNHCMSPKVVKTESRDIGEWSDDHPLNNRTTADAAYAELFKDRT